VLGAAQTAPITWTGAVNNDWNIGANWDTGTPPRQHERRHHQFPPNCVAVRRRD